MAKEQVFNMFLRKSPTLVKLSISLSVATESSDTSVFTVLLTSLFWSLCKFSESRVFKRFTKFSRSSVYFCIFTSIISATVNDNILQFFSIIGLACQCQCMWLFFASLKDFTTTFCLSFKSPIPLSP